MDETTDGKKPRSLWGYGIAAVYSAFALATLGLVAFTMTQKVDLVASDYYARELKYEQQIDRARNTNDLLEQVTCELSRDLKSIRIQFPSGFKEIKGSVVLYRPSESGLDQKLEVAPDERGLQEISTSTLATGFWRIKVTWSSGGREYYSEYQLKV